MNMSITLGCNSATVSVLDSAGYEVVTFDNVKVSGATGACGRGVIGADDRFGSPFGSIKP